MYEENEEPKYSNSKRLLKRAKMQRQVRKSQRKLKHLRAWYRLFIVVVLICLAILIVRLPEWRLPSDAFDSVKSPSLEILNNKIVPSQKVLAALRRNQVSTKPIFILKTDNLKKSIMQLEPVSDVYIRRYWFPARLQIILIERTPILTIAPDTEVEPIAFFSTDGKLIGRDYMPLSDDYKTYRVITYGSGDDYRTWDKKKVLNFKKLASLIEIDSGENVEYIDYRNPRDVYVKIPTANIRLGSINMGTFDKIHRLPSLLPQVKMLNKKIKYIDLRWETNFIKLDE